MKVGQTVLYAVRHGSCQTLKLAWVLAIVDEEAHVRVVADGRYGKFTSASVKYEWKGRDLVLDECSDADPSYVTWISGANCIVLDEFDVQPIRRLQAAERAYDKVRRENLERK
jgi:hypothetical protein